MSDTAEKVKWPWFAVQVWAGREHSCAKHLVIRGYDVLLPSFREQRRWSDRVKTMERAIFTGYLFCRTSGESLGKILAAPGTIRIVGVGGHAVPVAPEEISALQRIVELGLSAEPWEFIQTGQRIRIVQGPLRDCEGVVLSLRNRHRLIVGVTLLQRSVAVEIDPAWIEVPSHVLFAER